MKITHPVTLTNKYAVPKENKLKPYASVDQLRKQGVNINASIDGKQMASLLKFQGKRGDEYWIGLKNFYVITRYNHSELYAMAVFQLSEKLED